MAKTSCKYGDYRSFEHLLFLSVWEGGGGGGSLNSLSINTFAFFHAQFRLLGELLLSSYLLVYLVKCGLFCFCSFFKYVYHMVLFLCQNNWQILMNSSLYFCSILHLLLFMIILT